MTWEDWKFVFKVFLEYFGMGVTMLMWLLYIAATGGLYLG